MENNRYLKIIRRIFKYYPEKHQEIVEDLHNWLDDKYAMPVTKELRQIIKEVNEIKTEYKYICPICGEVYYMAGTSDSYCCGNDLCHKKAGRNVYLIEKTED